MSNSHQVRLHPVSLTQGMLEEGRPDWEKLARVKFHLQNVREVRKIQKSPAVRGLLIWVFNFENLLNLFEKYSVDKKKKIYLHIFSE